MVESKRAQWRWAKVGGKIKIVVEHLRRRPRNVWVLQGQRIRSFNTLNSGSKTFPN